MDKEPTPAIPAGDAVSTTSAEDVVAADESETPAGEAPASDEIEEIEAKPVQSQVDRSSLNDPNKKWYVVSAQAGQEKRAAATLEERVKYSDLTEKFGAILVPSEEVVELRGGKRRRSERRFYPGYIFVHMEMNESTWELVTKTTRISGFVGGTIAKPTPLPKAEIQLILDRIDQGGEKVTPKTVFEPGELIRIIDGPFNEFSGTVEEVNYKKQQLVVAVTIFGRSTPVELDFSQVEKG